MSIDVIVPVYNGYADVRNCLESIANSACETEFNVVVIDDGSSDVVLKSFLKQLDASGQIRLLTNPNNLGFTRTVNRGMRLNPERDVVLLNSDTIVYDGWLDRLVRAAYAEENIATSNPLTNSNGSHISHYPRYEPTARIPVEVDDRTLAALAADVNDRRYIHVHVTVGFCMFIKRACLDQIGLFDAAHFPIGYGEESDFCYRAVKVGWKHVIAGDVFVTHLEDRSFGERKVKLVQEMLQRFVLLHPEIGSKDRSFREKDPVRPLRSRLDLARVRRILGGRTELPMLIEGAAVQEDLDVYLAWAEAGVGQVEANIAVRNGAEFPNLGKYILRRDTATFNGVMRFLGTDTIRWHSEDQLPDILKREEFPFEIRLEPRIISGAETRQLPRIAP